MNLYYCVFKWTALGNEERAQIFFCKLSLLLGLTGFKLIYIVNCTMIDRVSCISINHSKLHVTSYVQKSISTIDISAAVSPSWWLLCFIHFSDTSYNTVNFHFKALHKVFLRREMYWCGMKILICSYILKTNKCLSIPRWWKRVNFDNNWSGR